MEQIRKNITFNKVIKLIILGGNLQQFMSLIFLIRSNLLRHQNPREAEIVLVCWWPGRLEKKTVAGCSSDGINGCFIYLHLDVAENRGTPNHPV